LGQVGIGVLNDETEPEPSAADSPNNIAALLYTFGTTGVPKGVMLTHRNLLFLAAGSAQIRSINPQDRVYGVLPM
jgi:long-chain acyl-CoA synthetase